MLVRTILIVYAVLAGITLIAYLPKLIQFRYAFKKLPYKRATANRRIALVIPARGESKIIGDLFASIRAQTYDPAFFSVNIIVKDADDPTVELAKKAGYAVFVVPGQTCKGDALDGFFQQFPKEEFARHDAFVIVDADAVLTPNYLYELNNALETDKDVYITRKYMKNALGGKKTRTVFSNCSALTWPILDDLGNRYRTLNEMPVTLCGQGMMVRRRVIERLGGWPYRTLTEDYEMKLDGILKGFTSIYYPYAILYTEEALGHRENFRRRVRWVTGYSQCDKIYKKQIKAQIKDRGEMTSGEFEYLYGLYPLICFAVLTILTVLMGGILSVGYAVVGKRLWVQALIFLCALPTGILYLLLFLYSVLTMLACPEMFAPIGFWEKFATLLFNPLYLLEYFPIYIKSRIDVRKDKNSGWAQTERITTYHR